MVMSSGSDGVRLQAHNVKSKVILVFNTSFYNAAPGVRSTPGIMGITAICPPGFKEPRHVHRIIAEEILMFKQGIPNVFDAHMYSYVPVCETHAADLDILDTEFTVSNC